MVIASKVEERVGLKNTKSFIEANPVDTEPGTRLYRPKVADAGAGGVRKNDPDLLPPQMFRIVPMSGLVWDRSRSTPDEGNVQDVTSILIGMPDVDVKKNDYFPQPDNKAKSDHGGWYIIHHVSPITGYRRECRLRFVQSRPRP